MKTKAQKRHERQKQAREEETRREEIRKARWQERHNIACCQLAQQTVDTRTGDTMHVKGKGRMSTFADYQTENYHVQARPLTRGQFNARADSEYSNGLYHVSHDGDDRSNKRTVATLRQKGEYIALRIRKEG